MIVIPAIDMKGGSCVRLYQGEFDRQTKYSDDPAAVARGFHEWGFSHLHLVDLDGARTGDQKNRTLVRSITSESTLRVQLGGGIRDDATVSQWLDHGVDRCVVGSVAISDPATVRSWLGRFGPDRIVLALDVRLDAANSPRLAIHGWTQTAATTLWECVEDYCRHGLRHVLCTDISRDGAMSGPNVDLYREFVERYPEIQLQASGGVRHAQDLDALRVAGAAAAITGRALLDGRINKTEISSFLPGA